MIKDFMSYQETAEMLDLPVGTLYSMVSRHQIPHYRLSSKLVRFSRNELQAWVTKRQVCPSIALAEAVEERD